MSGILAYRAKRALFDRIDTLLSSDTVGVFYVFPGDPPRTCVYGGALRFTQSDAVAEAGVMALETATVDVWIRHYLPGDDTRAADQVIEGLAVQIAQDFAAHPKLVDPLTVTSVLFGDAGEPAVSAAPEPSVISKLLLQFVVEGQLDDGI